MWGSLAHVYAMASHNLLWNVIIRQYLNYMHYHYQLNRRWSYDMDKWFYLIRLYAYDYLFMRTVNAGLANSSE